MQVLLILLLLVSGQTVAAAAFDIRDPVGDDHGAGDILYPNRADLRPGDLDVVLFSADNEAGGTWFRVEFANPVRSPAGEATEIGQIPMSRLARNGFYTFNVDIYIDKDLEPGSGFTEGLPGRKISIDPATAWEKTVLLTPRPGVARTMLQNHLERIEVRALRAEQGRIVGEDRERITAQVAKRIEDRYYLPDRVRVRGREIAFYVPAEFLGGPASRDWAYTVVVTGAELEQTTRLGTSTENFLLMNLPIERGLNFRNFGLRGEADIEQPPVIDYVNPRAGWQSARLSDYNLARGLFASLVGVAPSGRDLGVEPQVNRQIPVAREPAQPPRRGEPATEREAAGPIPTGDSLADRLRAIKALRDQGLLTEDEYQKVRRRLLAEY